MSFNAGLHYPSKLLLHFNAIPTDTTKTTFDSLPCFFLSQNQKKSPTETGTSTSGKKGQMSILSKRTNACARHEIDSKLETMRLRITENSAGGGATASFYIFSKVCYLHKDYVKLLEEIFPKPIAHSQQSLFLSLSGRKETRSLSGCGRPQRFFKKGKKKKKVSTSSCTDVTQPSLLFQSRYFLPWY